jgi:hypothetical protein
MMGVFIVKPASSRLRHERLAANLMLNEGVEAITHEVMVS